MQIEEHFDFLAPLDIRIKGHRIGLETLLWDHLSLGLSAEEIAIRYPTLPLDAIYASLAFYWANRERMDAYLKACDEEFENRRSEQARQPPPGLGRLQELAKKRASGQRDAIQASRL
jgi:uncharacterized protein (DUF433 family)